MLGQFLITFRETLEAALIISIIVAYLVRTKKSELTSSIWLGVGIAVAVSVILGIIIWSIYGGLSEANSKLFEGVAALIAVAVLTYMIIWMAVKGKELKGEIQKGVDTAIQKGTAIGFIGLAFVLVFREGLETVLFLTPFGIDDAGGTMAGALLGITFALAISFAIFKVGMNIDLKKFFYFSSLLLIFLAAGLAGYGIHELIEYREVTGAELGLLSSYAFNLGIDSDSIFYHKGVVGSIFAVMFGYSVKMEWARLIVHMGYLAVFIPTTILAYKKPEKLEGLYKLAIKTKSIFRRNKDPMAIQNKPKKVS
jgi:high-affinity iron transporter